MMRVYYHPETGEIVGHEFNTSAPMELEGHEHLEIELCHFHRLTHIMNLETKTIRERTDAEKREIAMPTRRDVLSARWHELSGTDWQEKFPDWAAYRQTLRDITTHGDIAAMIEAWPLRPDGSDAIPGLRRRMS